MKKLSRLITTSFVLFFSHAIFGQSTTTITGIVKNNTDMSSVGAASVTIKGSTERNIY